MANAMEEVPLANTPRRESTFFYGRIQGCGRILRCLRVSSWVQRADNTVDPL